MSKSDRGYRNLEGPQSRDDDFEIEMVDLDTVSEEPNSRATLEDSERNGNETTVPSAPVRVSLRSRLTQRQRLWRVVGLAIAVIVALVLILNSIAPAHTLLGLLAGPTPTATATLAPTADYFYLDASPPWGRLTLDGQPLDFTPLQPVHLSPGLHYFVWKASPFQTVKCTLSVPIATTNTCKHTAIPTQVDGAASTAQEVTFYDTLNMLPGTQQGALIQATQAALDSVQSTVTVQPGEQFVHVVGTQTTEVATQPLHATLHYSLSVGDARLQNVICANYYSEECGSLYRFQARDAMQNCDWFCTNTGSYTTFTVPNYWETIVIAHEYWTFTTLDGHTIAAAQPDTPQNLNNSAHLLFLNILWDGTRWQVTFDTLQASGYNTLGCLAADNALNKLPPPLGINSFGFSQVPAPVAADGCLEIVESAAANPSSSVPQSPPKAFCLYRFGVLLAANALAHQYWPSLPVATSYEQALAKRLAATQTH